MALRAVYGGDGSRDAASTEIPARGIIGPILPDEPVRSHLHRAGPSAAVLDTGDCPNRQGIGKLGTNRIMSPSRVELYYSNVTVSPLLKAAFFFLPLRFAILALGHSPILKWDYFQCRHVPCGIRHRTEGCWT